MQKEQKVESSQLIHRGENILDCKESKYGEFKHNWHNNSVELQRYLPADDSPQHEIKITIYTCLTCESVYEHRIFTNLEVKENES
tara:strand:- start:7232 stop:7486 length:255 start_codon:yes stop_codon:yes gene_type:complete